MDDEVVQQRKATQARSEQLLIEGEQLRGRSAALHQWGLALHQRSRDLRERSRELQERFAMDQAANERPGRAEDQGDEEHS